MGKRTGSCDHDRCSDDVRIHARLRVVVKCHKCPVCDDACDTLTALKIWADDKVFHGGCVHHDYVREGENFGENG